MRERSGYRCAEIYLHIAKLQINFNHMKRIIVTFAALLLLFSSDAQDKHFTQFYASPLTLNPALTGAFNGRYRVGGIYRDQWRNVLESPYTTFAGAVDVRWDLELDSRFKDALGVGILFYNDRVGGIDFSTNQMALSAAFHKGLDYDKKQFLSAGFQLGIAQRNVNYEDLFFDDQFNDLDQFNGATGENLPENNFSFADFSAGLNYTFSPTKRMSFFIGGAVHHLNSPQISFFPEQNGGESELFTKYSAQFSAQIPLTDRLSLIPRALFAKQGPHVEMNFGSNLRIGLNDFTNNAVQFGSWVRPVTNEDDQLALDALIVLFGLEISNVLIGFSYDVNLNAINTINRSQNAFEISVVYLGEFDDESIMCPKF